MFYVCCISTSTQYNCSNSIIIHISPSSQCPYCIIDQYCDFHIKSLTFYSFV
uniref:Uncharacterized protein n=1 Tax=Arundo donax TaxID=35708 RepID=A0A0A9B5C2_ARUDO